MVHYTEIVLESRVLLKHMVLAFCGRRKQTTNHDVFSCFKDFLVRHFLMKEIMMVIMIMMDEGRLFIDAHYHILSYHLPLLREW